MSFINANTANPTNSSQIGYTTIIEVPHATNTNTYTQQPLFTVPTTGVWLINASVYVTIANNQLSAIQLNILLPTTSNTFSYSNESAELWFSSVYIQATTLNVMTVQWANAGDTFGIAITSSGYFNVTASTNLNSVLRATKIA